MARVSKNHRILTCDCLESEFSGETAINLSDDTVFQFLNEESEGLSCIFDDDADDDEKENQNENEFRGAEDVSFWETQNQLLQVSCEFSQIADRKFKFAFPSVISELGEFLDGNERLI